MQDTTLLYLIKRTDGKVSEICLAMKKRGLGVGRWNGVGGKLLPGESITGSLIRETEEEIRVVVKEENLKKVAELAFAFPHKPEWDQTSHVFFAEKWKNEPTESEEMDPEWFGTDNLPMKDMWPDDEFWLPKILQGQLVKGSFVLGEGDTPLKHKVEIVKNF